jgi:hypothetical protein
MAGNVDSGLSSNQTTSGASFQFTLTGSETYSMAIVPHAGGAALFTRAGFLANTGAGGIDSLEIVLFENGSGNRVSGGGAQPTGQSEFFFNNLQVSSAALGGDYNADGQVDGSDFLVWQRLVGSSSTLADGNHNGLIDAGDLAIWRDQFGMSGSAMGVNALPEPGLGVLLSTGWMAAVRGARMKRRRPLDLSMLNS